jgi:hypothetical protein
MNLKQFIPPIIIKIINKFYILRQFMDIYIYIRKVKKGSSLFPIKVKLVGNCAGDPTEFFSHYEAFSFFVNNDLKNLVSKKLSILDVGSPKMFTSSISVYHNVSSLVLANPSDNLSNTKYITHDVSNELPFQNNSFDIFTSTVSIPLLGLGRYGDKVDPNAIENFIQELSRVMRNGSTIYISMCLGHNILCFNNGYYLTIEKIESLFFNFKLKEYLIDMWSGQNVDYSLERYSNKCDLNLIPTSDYKVIIMKFEKI